MIFIGIDVLVWIRIAVIIDDVKSVSGHRSETNRGSDP